MTQNARQVGASRRVGTLDKANRIYSRHEARNFDHRGCVEGLILELTQPLFQESELLDLLWKLHGCMRINNRNQSNRYTTYLITSDKPRSAHNDEE